MEERTYLVMEYHKRRGTKDFKGKLVQDFLHPVDGQKFEDPRFFLGTL